MGRPSKPSPSPLGRLIREQRELADLTQAELAKKIGVTEGYVSRMEAGTRKPSEDVAALLAQVLHLSAVRIKRLSGHLDDEALERMNRFPPIRQAVMNDPALTNDQRRALLLHYYSYVGRPRDDEDSV